MCTDIQARDSRGIRVRINGRLACVHLCVCVWHVCVCVYVCVCDACVCDVCVCVCVCTLHVYNTKVCSRTTYVCTMCDEGHVEARIQRMIEG